MKLFFHKKNIILLIFSTTLLTANTARSDLISPSRIWEQPISHVYVCSEAKEISSESLEEFYAKIPQVSAEFNNGWREYNDEKTYYGDVVIVSIAAQEYSSELGSCLREISFFQTEWLEDIEKQASDIGTVPEYLANTPFGKHHEPLKASWVYRYGDGVVLSSYIYKSLENFSYEDAVRGALQFEGSP